MAALSSVKSRRSGFLLRLRLLRRVFYRGWKTLAISRARRWIKKVTYEMPADKILYTPALFLSTFSGVHDFFVLSYLFRDNDLVYLAPKTLPTDKWIRRLAALNLVLSFDEDRVGFVFFRKLLTELKDFNRSVVISPEAAKAYAGRVAVDPGVIAKIAMMASVPIVPVVLRWSRGAKNDKACAVSIGKKLYVSPRTPEFKDIFFGRRGIRKFDRLSREELGVIGRRIFSKLEELAVTRG